MAYADLLNPLFIIGMVGVAVFLLAWFIDEITIRRVTRPPK